MMAMIRIRYLVDMRRGLALLQKRPALEVVLDKLQHWPAGQRFDGAVGVHARLVVHLGLQLGHVGRRLVGPGLGLVAGVGRQLLLQSVLHHKLQGSSKGNIELNLAHKYLQPFCTKNQH